jgi:hypothetical protein
LATTASRRASAASTAPRLPARVAVGGVRHARPGGVRLEIAGQHVHPVVHEALRDRTAHAASRAGDENGSAPVGHGVNFTVMTSPSRMT